MALRLRAERGTRDLDSALSTLCQGLDHEFPGSGADPSTLPYFPTPPFSPPSSSPSSSSPVSDYREAGEVSAGWAPGMWAFIHLEEVQSRPVK